MSKPTYLTDESEALDTIVQIEQEFGWVSVVVDRESVEYSLGIDLTDDQWERLRVSRQWTRHLPEAMGQGLPDLISEITHTALPDLDDNE
jgi:hypothetical protein